MVLHDGSTRLGAPLKYGDTCIVYESRDAMKSVTLTPAGFYRSKHGNFSHDEWVATRVTWGSRVVGAGGRGYVHLLRPTPELWTRVLRHRTQILYTPDVANIVAGLQLRPGCCVLETGTGSGSLTTSLARAVAPHGRVFTFEFHAERAQAARDDFAQNKLEHLVTVFVRDTEANGFPESLHGGAHAVFLDLPGPQKVAASAFACLRPDGMLCSFSPCIEQVQRMCLAMAAAGLTDIRTIEVLDREYQFARKPHLALPDMVAGNADVGAAVGQSSEAMPAPAKRPADTPAVDAAPPPAKRVQWKGSAGVGPAAVSHAAPVAEPPAAHGDAAMEVDAARANDAADLAPGGATPPPDAQPAPDKRQRREVAQQGPLLAWPCPDARGHTGYLTFARKQCVP